MPIYEYQCTQCGAHLEKRQSVSDEPLKTCEKCGGPLEKKWSLSGFQFKGEGWYVTDYTGKKDKAGDAKAVGPDAGEKSSSGESTAAADSASKPKSETTAVPKTGGGEAKSE